MYLKRLIVFDTPVKCLGQMNTISLREQLKLVFVSTVYNLTAWIKSTVVILGLANLFVTMAKLRP